MAVQLSVAVRNARLDQIETTIGVSPFLDFRTGAQPVNCAAADSGTELEHMSLPSDWMAAASAGVKGKNGTWTGTVDAAGTAAHFRVKETTDTTCEIQGSITAWYDYGSAVTMANLETFLIDFDGVNGLFSQT
jgi:hypothetical protein